MNTIEKINAFERFGSVLGLERMNILLQKMGNPQDDLKVIHVAGTNGKGSVCKYIYEVLEEAGYKAGLYTSPYLEVFNERIEFDRAFISDDDLAKYTDIVLAKADEMVREGYDSPTEFEVITAIAFLYFHEKNCDYVVLEVGLGGRGDSTNVVRNPLVSVITSISFDHTDRLGNTIEEIASEKAGIIKPGCPVVISTEREGAEKVFREQASSLRAPLYDARESRISVTSSGLFGSVFTADCFGTTYRDLEISMSGAHQIANAAEALCALTILRDEGKAAFTEAELRRGMKLARQIGRMEVMSRDPYIVIDGAHNPDGAKALRRAIAAEFSGKRVLMITGILADKDTDGILSEFCGITDTFIATEPDNLRRMTAEDLAAKLTERNCRAEAVPDPIQAAEKAIRGKDRYDLILFAGSLYLIGKIRTYLNHRG